MILKYQVRHRETILAFDYEAVISLIVYCSMYPVPCL